jgi:CheY-like chemotaxis protein
LLTGVVMPGMTGRDLAARLQRKIPLMKILSMSGYTADVIAKQGILDPGVAYLPKPFTPSDLSLKVRDVLTASQSVPSRTHDPSGPYPNGS